MKVHFVTLLLGRSRLLSMARMYTECSILKLRVQMWLTTLINLPICELLDFYLVWQIHIWHDFSVPPETHRFEPQ